jgi:hypothetical protein
MKKIFFIILFFSSFGYTQSQNIPYYSSVNNYSYSSNFTDKMKTIIAFLKTYFVFTNQLPDGYLPIKIKYGNAWDMAIFAWKNASGCSTNCGVYNIYLTGVAAGLMGCDPNKVKYYTADNSITHDFNRGIFDQSPGCGVVYFYPPASYCASGLSGTCNINPSLNSPIGGSAQLYNTVTKTSVYGGAMYATGGGSSFVDAFKTMVNPYPYSSGTKIITSIPTISQSQFQDVNLSTNFVANINSFPDYAKNYLQNGYIEATTSDVTGINIPTPVSTNDYTNISGSTTTTNFDLTPLTDRWDAQFANTQNIDNSVYTSTASSLWQNLKTSAEAIPNFLKNLFTFNDEWDGCFTFDFTGTFQGAQKTTFCLSEIPNWNSLLPLIRTTFILVSFILGYYFFLEGE